ncbi:MAG: dihydroorotase [Sedimenticolaceae bacterium]
MKGRTLAAKPTFSESLPVDHAAGGGQSLSDSELRTQNRAYLGSGGVSQRNRHAGFVPAYKNLQTGEAIVSRFADGRPAPVHVLEGLPDEWVASRDRHGNIRRIFASVIAGFVREGCFYTREAAARIVAEENCP